MLVRQVTAQVFGNDVDGVEVQLTIDEAVSIASILYCGLIDPDGDRQRSVSEQRGALLLEQLRAIAKIQ